MTELQQLRTRIEDAYERRASLSAGQAPDELDAALAECLELLDRGVLRVAEPSARGWVVNQWLKKAVLLTFRTRENRLVDGGFTRFYDKLPLKYSAASETELRAGGVRIVPHAVVRRGAYLAPDVVLMPSYVNIGAWIGSGNNASTSARSSLVIILNKNLAAARSLPAPACAKAWATRLACSSSRRRAKVAPFSLACSSRWRRSRSPALCSIQPWSTSSLRTRARLCLVIFKISSRSATRNPGLRLTKCKTR